MNSSVWAIWVAQCSKEKKSIRVYLLYIFFFSFGSNRLPIKFSKEIDYVTVYRTGTLCIYASVDLESPITTTLVVMTSIQRAHGALCGGRGSCSHWSKTGIIFQKVRSLNPIPTRFCHVIYCHGDKSYPCLVGIGFTTLLSFCAF